MFHMKRKKRHGAIGEKSQDRQATTLGDDICCYCSLIDIVVVAAYFYCLKQKAYKHLSFRTTSK